MRRPALLIALVLGCFPLASACSLFSGSDGFSGRDGSSGSDGTASQTVASPTTPNGDTTAAPSTSLATDPTSPSSEPTPDFADSFAQVSTGVYRVDARYCDGDESVGTAFLINRTLLLTALHVTGDATEVLVSRDDGSSSAARIVGTDQDRDLALLEVDQPLSGHTFVLRDQDIRVGDEVAALGHPRGLPLTFTSGRVSAVGFDDGGVLFHQTDAPVNPGNSGGPLIDARGQVIGMADWKFTDVEGISFVVAATEITAFLDSGQTRVVDAALGCEEGSDDEFVLATDDPILANVPDMFDDYAALINTSREGDAYERFAGPRLRSIISKEAFIEGNSTSILENMVVYNLFWTAEGTAEAWVTFVSYQDPVFGTDGQSCSSWDLTYDLIIEDDEWKIDRARNEPGSPAPC